MKDLKKLMERAKANNQLKDLTPMFVEWTKVNQSILGRFKSSSDVAGSKGTGTYKQYLFDTDEGLVKFALGSATDKEFASLLIQGEVYQIVYDGQIKISGARKVNKFKLLWLDVNEALDVEHDITAESDIKE